MRQYPVARFRKSCKIKQRKLGFLRFPHQAISITDTITVIQGITTDTGALRRIELGESDCILNPVKVCCRHTHPQVQIPRREEVFSFPRCLIKISDFSASVFITFSALSFLPEVQGCDYCVTLICPISNSYHIHSFFFSLLVFTVRPPFAVRLFGLVYTAMEMIKQFQILLLCSHIVCFCLAERRPTYICCV